MKPTGAKLDPTEDARERRWRLAIGADDETSSALSVAEEPGVSAALDALYGNGSGDTAGDPARGAAGSGLGAARLALARRHPRILPLAGRAGDPERRLRAARPEAMLMEPEFLATLEADVHLVADLIALRAAMPAKAKETARRWSPKVVDELMQRLAQKTAETIRGALDRARRTKRPRQPTSTGRAPSRANLDTTRPS